MKKRLVIVGLRQSGKSVLKAMLNGEELTVSQAKGLKHSLYESHASL